MATYQLFPCEYRVPCDTFQCHGRAKYFIGKDDAPKNTLTKVCAECADELIHNIIDHYVTHPEEDAAVEVNGDPVPQEIIEVAQASAEIQAEKLPFDDIEDDMTVKEMQEALRKINYDRKLGITGIGKMNRSQLEKELEKLTRG